MNSHEWLTLRNYESNRSRTHGVTDLSLGASQIGFCQSFNVLDDSIDGFSMTLPISAIRPGMSRRVAFNTNSKTKYGLGSYSHTRQCLVLVLGYRRISLEDLRGHLGSI